MTIELYPYQRDGVSFMYDKTGVILADDMGLGKTYQALAEIKQWHQEYPVPNLKVLIVAPKSALGVWDTHIEEFFPEINRMVVSGASKQKVADYTGGFLVINYEAVRLVQLKGVFDFVIADEAHNIKNRKAIRTRSLKKVKAAHKRALSGTPMINRPDELWSILHWLDPKTYSSYWRFFEQYVAYKDSGYGYKIVFGPKNTDELKRELAPIMIRRMKMDVLQDLPEKYYSYRKLDMSPEQNRAYKEMKKDSLAWIEQMPEDVPLPAPTVLSQLTRLRQFASAYCEIDDEGSVIMSEPSSKLDALVDIIKEANGQPVVVFSQFKQMVYLAEKRLTDKLGVNVVTFTGDTSQASREKIIADFQAGKYDVMLATIQAGGVGVTLHRASTVVFLDRAWSPAMNMQAEDRLHRIGQKNAVEVIILQSSGTVDLTIESKLERKKSWIRQCLGSI